MPQKFILEITLGNEGMCSAEHIGRVLAKTGTHIAVTGKIDIGKIRDINGNVVGHYEVI
jgi:hypothetical protein